MKPVKLNMDLSKIKELVTAKFTSAYASLAGKFGKGGGAGSMAQPVQPARTIGCDYGASKIVLMEIEKDGGRAVVQQFHIIPRPEAGASPAQILKGHFDKGYSTRRVRSSVKGQSVIMRFIQFPKMKIEELRSALTYEAENHIPFKLDEVILDFFIVDNKAGDAAGKMMDVLLVAVKKESIYSLIKDLQDADLQAEVIDTDVLASINALEYFYPEDFKKSVGFLDIGKEISSLSVIAEGKPRFIRDISFGGVDIAKRLRRKLGFTWPQTAEILEGVKEASPEALQVLKEAYETLCADLRVTLDYYQGQTSEARQLEKIFLGGGLAHSDIIAAAITEHLGIPAAEFTVLDKAQLAPGVDRALFERSQGLAVVAMGLCLR